MEDTDLIEIFGNNVRYYRFVRKMSQEKLAEKCRLSARYISDIENSNGNVSIKTLSILAKALNIDPMLLVIEQPHLELPKKINKS